jgi:superfamily II DNA or RNA helicase
MATQTFQPGKLVTFRQRDWVVLPSADADLLMLKPLGGSDEETMGIFLPLNAVNDRVREATFPKPSPDDIDDFESAKLLFDATRLSFRNASGPFRCMARLSFRPRAYQIVPLVMALKQQVVRLLIADDVGIGKTIEALLIIKEQLERGEIKNFAIVCLPHLCEQWQQEIKDKMGIEAEIIRSSTAASLERRLPDDRSVFYHIPYQVISIDYIKSDRRRGLFLSDCPDLVVVDEAHTCTRPAAATSVSQQQRYHLLYDIAKNPKQHLVLLTATPHSGKDPEFQSLLGLLNKEFETLDLEKIDQNQRRKIAKFFIQRKRENIARWQRKNGDEKTPFPRRESKEIGYVISKEYEEMFTEVRDFARGISEEGTHIKSSTIRYWAALALLRGIMSSPASGVAMLKNRMVRQMDEEEKVAFASQSLPLFEQSGEDSDADPIEYIDNADLDDNERQRIEVLCDKVEKLQTLTYDWKASEAIEVVKKWLKEGLNPIIFCKYIATARYLGQLVREALPNKVDVQVVTSELADEQRREKINLMESSSQRVLVATDCLSEGINLQSLFTAVLHYDLPWNPNRIEQREGRVDRFGQESPVVKTALLYGEDNPIDLIVLDVIIKKIRDIQRATGVSISIGEENSSLMNQLIKDVLLNQESKASDGRQLGIFAKELVSNEIEQARKKAENLRSIFAQESISPQEIEKSLDEVDEAIGDMQAVENFVKLSVEHLAGAVTPDGMGYRMDITNLPPHLHAHFAVKSGLRISFESPTPLGYTYLGRNHLFTEQLCQFMLSMAFEGHDRYKKVARSSVIRTDKVATRTTLIQFRVRNVIKEVDSSREVISEEMYLWGYRNGSAQDTLTYAEARELLTTAQSASGLLLDFQQRMFEDEMKQFGVLEPAFRSLAELRAMKLVEAHGGFKELVGGKRYEAVHPVLPPDVMGVYILLPKTKELF